MAQAAEVLTPIEIVGPMVTASSVAEPDTSRGEVVWVATDSHVIGQERIRPATHRVYTAIASGVDAGPPEDTPTRWKDTRPTNKYAAFDVYRNTAIKQAGTLTQTVKPGIITAMRFYGLVGDALRVVCKNATSGTVYFDQTTSLSTYLSGDLMWEFYFGTPRQQDGLSVRGLTPQDAQVEITLTPSPITGLAEIGIWALGSWEYLGIPLKGFRASPVDYSLIDVDAHGDLFIQKGLNAKNIVGECYMAGADAQAVVDVVYRLLGVPVAISISTESKFDYLNAFGLLSADITAPETDHAFLSLTVRGVI